MAVEGWAAVMAAITVSWSDESHVRAPLMDMVPLQVVAPNEAVLHVNVPLVERLPLLTSIRTGETTPTTTPPMVM